MPVQREPGELVGGLKEYGIVSGLLKRLPPTQVVSREQILDVRVRTRAGVETAADRAVGSLKSQDANPGACNTVGEIVDSCI